MLLKSTFKKLEIISTFFSPICTWLLFLQYFLKNNYFWTVDKADNYSVTVHKSICKQFSQLHCSKIINILQLPTPMTHTLPVSEQRLKYSEMYLLTFEILVYTQTNTSGSSHHDVISGPLSDTLLTGDCKGRTREEEDVTSVWILNCPLSLSNQHQGIQPESQTRIRCKQESLSQK